MPSQLSKGRTFTDGNTYFAADLNTLVDSATLLPGAIGEQASAVPVGADAFLLRQSSSASLKKCSLDQLISSFPRGAAAGEFALRKLGTQPTMAAAGDDSRFPAQVTGIRKGNGTAVDTEAEAFDFAYYKALAAADTQIDWDDADVFYKLISAPATFTFVAGSLRNGRRITVAIRHSGGPHAVTFTGHPSLGAMQSFGSGTTAYIYTFTCIAGVTVGWYVKV